MAKATYVKPHLSTFISPAQEASTDQIAAWQEVTHTEEWEIDDVTGSKGGVADTDPQYVLGLPTEELIASGWLHDGTGYISSNAITLTFGSLNLTAQEWVIGHLWPLDDVTGSGDAANVKAWTWGLGTMYLRARCVVTDLGPDLAKTAVDTLTAVGMGGGTSQISGSAWYELRTTRYGRRQSFAMHEITARFTGRVTWTIGTGGLDLSTVLDTQSGGAGIDPPRGTATMALSGGDSITGTYIAYHVQIRGTRRRGGGYPVVIWHRRDEPS